MNGRTFEQECIELATSLLREGESIRRRGGSPRAIRVDAQGFRPDPSASSVPSEASLWLFSLEMAVKMLTRRDSIYFIHPAAPALVHDAFVADRSHVQICNAYHLNRSRLTEILERAAVAIVLVCDDRGITSRRWSRAA